MIRFDAHRRRLKSAHGDGPASGDVGGGLSGAQMSWCRSGHGGGADRVVTGPWWAAVADGVGSLPGSWRIAAAAVASIASELSPMLTPRDGVSPHLEGLPERLFSQAWSEGVAAATRTESSHLAATLTVALIDVVEETVTYGWVGDSPGGLWLPDGSLQIVTNAHVDGSGQLERALTPRRAVQWQQATVRLPEGTAVWVASDGAVPSGLGYVPRESLVEAWTARRSADDAAVAVVWP